MSTSSGSGPSPPCSAGRPPDRRRQHRLADARSGPGGCAVRDLDVYIEQPCPSYEECLTIRRRTDHPFVLDEVIDGIDMLLRANADRAMDVVNLKISKLGGLTKARQARDLCVSLGVAMTIEDSWGGDIVTAAIAHLAHSTPPELLFTSTDFNSYVTVSIATGAPAAQSRPIGGRYGAGLGHSAATRRAGQAGAERLHPDLSAPPTPMTIAAEIKHDLQARIEARSLPERLTLAALSQHYGVSLTPVRTVVDELVRERYLHKQPNGRLAIGPQAGKPRKAKGSAARRVQRHARPTVAETSWQTALVREIIARSLRGERGYLREQATARHLSLGRTALRQAFGQLAGQGLLEHVRVRLARPRVQRGRLGGVSRRPRSDRAEGSGAGPAAPGGRRFAADAAGQFAGRRPPRAARQSTARLSRPESTEPLPGRLLRSARRVLHHALGSCRSGGPRRGRDGRATPGHPPGLAPGGLGPRPPPAAPHIRAQRPIIEKLLAQLKSAGG